MPDSNTIAQISSTLESVQSVMVVLSANSSVDELAAGLALHQGLQSSGKRSRLVSPRKPARLPEMESGVLVGAEEIGTELGNENLTISFDYSEDQVDKVSYHIGEETGKFHLTIKPKAGYAPLDSNTVEFGYTGASADLIILVGVSNLDSLEQLYFGYEDLYKNSPVLSVNTRGNSVGSMQLTPDHHSSLSELVAATLFELGIAINNDAATSLLYGIEQFSQNLTAPETEPETFEVVAQLLRSGARRMAVQKHKNVNGSPEQEVINSGSFGEALRNNQEAKEVPVELVEEEFEEVDSEQVKKSEDSKDDGKSNKKRRRRRRRQPSHSQSQKN